MILSESILFGKSLLKKNLFPWKEFLQQKIISLEIVSMKTVCLEKVHQNIACLERVWSQIICSKKLKVKQQVSADILHLNRRRSSLSNFTT